MSKDLEQRIAELEARQDALERVFPGTRVEMPRAIAEKPESSQPGPSERESREPVPSGLDGVVSWNQRPCKYGTSANQAFALPRSKKTGHPIPELPNDCPYYRCPNCNFLFSEHLDEADHTTVYDATYWDEQDPDWFGRVNQTLRLVLLANSLLKKSPDRLEILDFGCGPNGFVLKARDELQLLAWGTDIIPPKFAPEWFLNPLDRSFDIVVACEVIEHLPDPMQTFRTIRSHLNPGGVFAFQTAQYDPEVCNRDWWYLGPDNGHISLYAREALDHAFHQLEGRNRVMWNEYPGVQAWQF